MKKILVTGASGQVGRFLIRKLIEKELDFSGLDIQHYAKLPNFQFLKADLTKKTELEEIKSSLKDYSAVIHLASVIDDSQDVIKNGIASINLNIKGTLNLLEYLPNLEHLCFTSTYMVYGIPCSNPVSEKHKTEPINIYGASKLTTEKFLQVFAKQQAINLTILRFMGIYGLESPYAIQAIPSFIRLIATNQNPIIFGTGKARRNHIYIDDAIDSILSCLDSKKSGVFNIGGPEAPSNIDLVYLINEKMGKKIKPVFKETVTKEYDFIADISRARNDLGFEPVVGIDEGITRAIERYFLVEKK